MKAYLTCVACEQRELDSQLVLDYLIKNKITITTNPKYADYLFVITCGVDSSAENKSISEIRKIEKQMQENSKLIVGGCLPSISPKKLSEFKIYHTFNPRSVNSLNSILKLEFPIHDLPSPNKSIYDLNSEQIEENNKKTPRERFEYAKNGYKIVIADGCLGECTYCMIRNATGLLKSKNIEDILNQVKQGITDQEKTIMLMAGDTGAYGQDIGLNFSELLENIITIDKVPPLYIHDFGINWLIKDLNKYLAVFEKAECNEQIGGITLPLQSGNNIVLSRMKRKYNREDALNALNIISRYSFDIGTHIIIGFPGETEEYFQDTITLLKQINFDFITCFPYSEHPYSNSASLNDKIPKKSIENRIKRISEELGNKVKVIL